ncbi:hypothetical protein P4J20_22975, partial [Bacillus cereus]|nr:hypothetical protein [Bacillus cereus]
KMCILFYYYIPKDFARKSNKVVVPKSNDIIFSKSHRKSISTSPDDDFLYLIKIKSCHLLFLM